jgi:uncharacterized protein (TIGR00255 family)
MTGFARIRRTLPEGELVISLRSVNHRGLDLQFHLPAELEPVENAMRKALAARIVRGHISVRAQFTGNPATAATAINRAMLAGWLAAFRQASQEFGIPGAPDLNVALRIPGMIGEANADQLSALEAGVAAVLEDTISALNAERQREGAATARLLGEYQQRLTRAATQMEAIRAEILPHIQSRLQERLAELLRGTALDPARLVQEAAILADRSDVSEEIARLRIHASRLGELLATGGEVGKKIEFLAQEMHREANTVLSKSNTAGEPGRQIAKLGLEVKSEIEKIREQALNLE